MNIGKKVCVRVRNDKVVIDRRRHEIVRRSFY
jgi:hypothetical protein